MTVGRMKDLNLDEIENEENRKTVSEDLLEVDIAEDVYDESDASTDTNDDNETEVVVVADKTEEIETDEDDTENEDRKESVASKEQKRSSRAQDRIRKLVAERNAEKEARERLEEELKSLKTRNIQTQKATVESQKTFLAQHVENLKLAMKKAHTDGDSEAFVDLSTDLNDALLKLTALNQWEPEEKDDDNFDKKKPQQTQQQQQVQAPIEDAPEALQDWVSRNDWFQKPQSDRDIARIKSAVAFYDLLVAEGYDPEDDSFYDEIDARLGLAKSKPNTVESKESSPEKTLKRKKVRQQTIQGASRATTSSQSNRKRITLTPEQQKIADLYDMSYEEYARELLKIEESEKRGDRMVSLFEGKR